MREFHESVTVEDQAAFLVKNAMLRAVEQDWVVTPASEAQVHKAADLLRSTKADPTLLSKIEAISCTLLKMKHLQQQGRVNLYASQLLRLRSVANAL
jgi:hypothetical protein